MDGHHSQFQAAIFTFRRKTILPMGHAKEKPTTLTCFKAHDVRGELGINFDTKTAYGIGRAVAQHFHAENIVVGFDARETSQ